MQEQYQSVLKEIKILQQQEHTLQQESLGVRLRIEQIETTITEHNNKIKHWQKEVCVCLQLTLAEGLIGNNILTNVVSENICMLISIVQVKYYSSKLYYYH